MPPFREQRGGRPCLEVAREDEIVRFGRSTRKGEEGEGTNVRDPLGCVESVAEGLHHRPQKKGVPYQRGERSGRGIRQESQPGDAPDAEMLLVGRRIGQAKDDLLDQLDHVARVVLRNSTAVDGLEEEDTRVREPHVQPGRKVREGAARMESLCAQL